MKHLHINFFIATLALFQYISVDAASLRLICGSVDDYDSADLEDPTPLLNSPCYVPDTCNAIYAFGFTQSASGDDTKAIVNAYLNNGESCNIFVIDWEKEAAGGITIVKPLGYALNAVPNAIKVGKKCGTGLIALAAEDFCLSCTHLIGHSLGAQMVGYCGKEVQEKGKNVSRITGLDPAGPFFDGAISLDGLNPTRAPFVDVHHTNPGQLGSDENLGLVDIWYNFENGSQPECIPSNFIDVFQKASCSHSFAWKYFSAELLNPGLFQALKDTDYDSWVKRKTTGTQMRINLGDDTDTSARGHFYLSTNSDPPYGKGEAGLLYPQSSS